MVAAPSIAPSDAPRRGRGGRRRLTPQRALFFALFLGAPLLLYILFVVWPALQAIFYSLTNWRGLAATPEFIGLDNYVRLFNDGIFRQALDRKSTRLNSSHVAISYAVFCLKKKKNSTYDSKR